MGPDTMDLRPSGRRPKPRRQNRLHDFAKQQRGAAAAEFALVLPVLSILLFGIIQMGVIFNHYIELANGVGAAARTLAVSRGSALPYTNTLNALNAAAPNLNHYPAANQTLTVTVNSTVCSGDTACAAAYVQGATASVSATYPCTWLVPGVNPGFACSLTSSAAEYIQ